MLATIGRAHSTWSWEPRSTVPASEVRLRRPAPPLPAPQPPPPRAPRAFHALELARIAATGLQQVAIAEPQPFPARNHRPTLTVVLVDAIKRFVSVFQKNRNVSICSPCHLSNGSFDDLRERKSTLKLCKKGNQFVLSRKEILPLRWWC